jgi:hypothetical protein
MILKPIAIAKCPYTIGKYASIYSRVTIVDTSLLVELVLDISIVVPVFFSPMHD